ncbi:MAG: Cna B-type domain-containing protein, partial [Clostridiales bacterium]|nr:Cna B-type domain-containing protein [Clostridiales bacterium]
MSNGVATITVPAGGSVTLVNLPVGTYTVYETQTANSDGSYTVSDVTNTYTWTVSGDNDVNVDVTADETASAEITNTLTGTAKVFIYKTWSDYSNVYSTRPEVNETDYTVTLTATGTDDITYEYTTTATWTESSNLWYIEVDGVAAYDTNGVKLVYTVTETDVEGYTLTVTTEEITPANGGDSRNVYLTNTLKTANVTVTKKVVDSDGNELTTDENSDTFRFALYDDENVSYGTVTLAANESYTFENVPLGGYNLTEYLVGNHSHTYDTDSTKDGEDLTVTENWVYDSTEEAYVKTHTISFTLDEDDNGLTVNVVVTNQEEEISVSLAALVNGTKTLESDNEVTKTFTYTVKEASIINGVETEGDIVATGTATVSGGETEDIEWTILDEDAFTYTEVGTYYYVIYEDVATGTGTGGVIYDSTRYTLTITVSKDENGGGLIATATMTKNVENSDGTRTTSTVTSDSGATSFTAASTEEDFELSDSFTAAFVNSYDATETSIILRASKVLTGRTLIEGEFTIEIQELDESYEPMGDPVYRSNGATGAFGYEIVFDEAGTYIYKVSEVQGDLASVTYDGHYYIIYVYVEDDNGVLTVTGTDVEYYDADDNLISGDYSFDSLTFTNTYTAEGSGVISAYKVMQGRDFNVGETFTFLIEAMENGAPALTDPGLDNVVFTDNGDGTYTVTVTVTADMVVDTNDTTGDSIFNQVLANIVVDQDDVGQWVYRVTETSASEEDNGMTLNTAYYGHLITVTVTDDGDGTMTVTTKSTNDTDWNGDGETDTASSAIVNTFDPGTMTIYGRKTWVDGGASHDNTTEVTLTLYYRYLILANEENGLTEDTWSEWAEYTGSYTVTWGSLYTNAWHFADLPVYSEDGYEIQSAVEEAEVSGCGPT